MGRAEQQRLGVRLGGAFRVLALAFVLFHGSSYADSPAAPDGALPEAPSGLSGASFKVVYLDRGLSEMRALPGHVKGRICADDTWFGFEQYMVAGKTPKYEDVPTLYKQFVTVTNVVDMLVECGVPEFRNVEVGRVEGVAGMLTCYDYDLEFAACPSALVKVLNALATTPRFYVVREFEFWHEGESLRDRLERNEASETMNRSSRRRTRDRKVKVGNEDGGIVTDPRTDPPFRVRMRLSVYDFVKGAFFANRYRSSVCQARSLMLNRVRALRDVFKHRPGTWWISKWSQRPDDKRPGNDVVTIVVNVWRDQKDEILTQWNKGKDEKDRCPDIGEAIKKQISSVEGLALQGDPALVLNTCGKYLDEITLTFTFASVEPNPMAQKKGK